MGMGMGMGMADLRLSTILGFALYYCMYQVFALLALWVCGEGARTDSYWIWLGMG